MMRRVVSLLPRSAGSKNVGQLRSFSASVDYSLYAVAYQKYFADDIPDRINALISGGVSCVMLNFKDAQVNAYVEMAKRVLEVTRPAGVPMFVENNLHVCLESDADGLHIGVDVMDPALARRHLGPEKLLGISTLGEPARLRLACSAEVAADYVSAGGVAPSANSGYPSTKGATHLRGVKDFMLEQKWSQPLIASGGIGLHNISDVIRSGADGAMCVSFLFEGLASADAARAREIRQIINKAKETE